MADASQIVSPILKAVIGKLGSRLWTEVELLWSVENDFKELQELSSTVADVLDDAERRSISSRALSNWLRRLKDVTFDVDDVVDEFHTEALRQRTRSDNCITGQVCDFFSSNNPIVFNFKIAHKIKDVRKKFKGLADLRKDFISSDEGSSSSERMIRSSSSETVADRETHSCINESEIYGRHDDKENIIHFLVNMDDNKDVSVLPIVGLAGVGKTTVAQLVYNDERVKECFELQIWICVSEDFNIKDIANKITKHITKKEGASSDLETVQQCLQQQLRDKKFLLVLDDIWNENAGKWNRLKSLLEGGRVGSKIIVTTRSNTVAAIMCTVKAPHKLDVLSDDDCWIIFKRRAFGVGREENLELVEIGMEIVSRCRGLPLAANALGSLMATKYGVIEWLGVKNSEIWRLPEDEVEIIPALKLSYDYLPPHLKHCFAYCSMFLKDSKIRRWDLVQLWIAEGFVSMQEKDMLAEDVGNQYFDSLLQRSFFQEEQRNIFGDIEWCKMHDLMHDLACYVARGESCIMQAGKEPNVDIHRCRYILVARTIDEKIPLTTIKLVCGAKSLRSLFLADIEKSAISSIPNLIYLRALDLSYTSVEELPSTIGKLKYLRFLDLSRTSIQVLPDSIANLYNLQTLKLRACTKLRELPEGTRNMSSLRHLNIDGCVALTRMPRGLGRLRSLQTLSLFIVGEEPGCTIVELQHLNLIRSELKIQHLENVKDPVEGSEARLSEKTSLRYLELQWHSRVIDVDEDVLESLQPPPNLRRLVIDFYSGSRLPRWLTKIYPSSPSFPYLQELSLRHLENCKSLGSLGHLQSLKRLMMVGVDGVRSIGREFYGDDDDHNAFPSLTFLQLDNMFDLKEWVVPERAFPCLEEVELAMCSDLAVQTYLPSSILKLSIGDCKEELLGLGGSLQGLSRLRKLNIEGMKSWKSDWKGLQHLTALQKLKVRCPYLTYLPEGVMNLSSLQSLTLESNHDLESLSISSSGGRGRRTPPLFLNTLRHLMIDSSPKLTALPEWLGCLTSLHSLTLVECPNLAMIPDGMKHLTSLRDLSIWICPILERRCERERGDDWHKIAHIPNIKIRSGWGSE